MLPKNILGVFLTISLLCSGCVGNDFIDDRVEERLSFDNPISEIQVNDTYQLNVTFFNNVGQPESANVQWTSSNPTVATISNSGLLTAFSEGETTIRASVVLEDGTEIQEEQSITVTTEPVDPHEPITKSGIIVTTSSYTLTGNFTLAEILDSDHLDLQIDDSYQASTSLPGLYLYLTNNPNSISGALELGPVQIFSGAHSYEISNTGINEYKYLLYWCKPFSVKVGEGEIND
jgi:hypothetical protein